MTDGRSRGWQAVLTGDVVRGEAGNSPGQKKPGFPEKSAERHERSKLEEGQKQFGAHLLTSLVRPMRCDSISLEQTRPSVSLAEHIVLFSDATSTILYFLQFAD